MNLRKLLLTENACFKAGDTITPKGIMVHSTGAYNPWLRRYVGPDDGLLGRNRYNNHWNQARPGGRKICVHAFIGLLADGSVATYQTLPWNHRGWHCARGPEGSGNDTHISFEICEGKLDDGAYFAKVYREAVELCAHLCKLYGLTEREILCHSEGHARGIASNHADVMHWFPRHGKTMDDFRTAVKAELAGNAPEAGQLYRVRKTWADAASQKGAFRVLDNAKRCADENAGYFVFDENGGAVYPAEAAPATYTVKAGDSLWGIAANVLHNGARYEEIKRLNGLRSDTIHAGQVLKLPT